MSDKVGQNSDAISSPSSASNAEAIDEEFVNIPEMWPQLSRDLVNSICNGPGQYLPVPMLRSKNDTYLPLQVFPDAASFTTGSVLKLDSNQERVLKWKATGYRRSLLRRVQKTLASRFNRRAGADEQTCKVHFREEYKGKTNGEGYILDQRITRLHSSESKDLDHDTVRVRNSGQFRLKLTNIYYRSIQPHALLDCRIPPGSPILRMRVKQFYVIYDTCIAREIQFTLKRTCRSDRKLTEELDHDGGDDNQERMVRLKACPIAFRCVQATVDDNGVIVDLRYHVSPREVLGFDAKVKYAVLSPEMLIHMEVPGSSRGAGICRKKLP